MGGWAIFCAICGGPFSSQVDMDAEGIGEDHYRYEVLKDCDLGWLDKLRSLGVNPEAHGNNKSFLTGSGRYWDCGFIEVAAGDDPNFPFRNDCDEVISMTAYHDFSDIGAPHVFPFHSVCYEDILQRCIANGNGKSEPIKGAMLFNVFEDLNGPQHVRLELSYGEPEPPAEQVWRIVKGQELLVANPVEIPQLDADLDAIVNSVDTKRPNRHSQNQDIFNRLPSELRQEILKLLPAGCILALKAASWTMHTTTLSPILWKDRLRREMPWLWEIGEIDIFQSQELEAKASELLLRIQKKSQYTCENDDYILGLANRRRIWGVCEQIRSYYLDKLAADSI